MKFFRYTVLLQFLLAFNYIQTSAAFSQSIEQKTVQSQILNRDQAIQIYTPVSYASSTNTYPTLYILDGQFYFYYGVAFQQTADWQYKSLEFLVVGISTENKELRNLDFGSDLHLKKYRDFLEKELIPFVEKNYRVTNDRMIFGWQSAGYFATETLFAKPDLFNAYFVASGATIDSTLFDQFLKRDLKAEKFLYFAHSPKETWAADEYSAFTERLQKNTLNNLRWEHESLPEEDHWSTPYRTIYRGLTAYYRDFQPIQFASLDEYQNNDGFEAVVRHYRERGEKFNVPTTVHHSTIFNLLSLSIRADSLQAFEFFMTHFTGEIPGLYPVLWLDRYGQFYLKHNAFEKAEAFYKNAISSYPEAAILYASLGDVYRKSGAENLAKAAYLKAIEFAQKTDDPELEMIKAKSINK